MKIYKKYNSIKKLTNTKRKNQNVINYMTTNRQKNDEAYNYFYLSTGPIIKCKYLSVIVEV